MFRFEPDYAYAQGQVGRSAGGIAGLEHRVEALHDDIAARRVRGGSQYRELVAAEPTDDIAIAEHTAQDLCRLHQHRIAGGMSGRVIDGLEVVDIKIEQQGAMPVAAGGFQQAGSAAHGTAAIVQSPQLVDQRHRPQRQDHALDPLAPRLEPFVPATSWYLQPTPTGLTG